MSLANGRLAVSHADGTVRVWTPTSSSGDPFYMDQTFSPFDDDDNDKPLASVAWVGANSLVCGSRQRFAALWTLGDGSDDMMGAEAVRPCPSPPPRMEATSSVYNFVCCASPSATHPPRQPSQASRVRCAPH